MMPTKILIINPNSTASMTQEITTAARGFALKGTEVTAINPPNGPASIQGPEDGKACLPGLYSIFEDARRANDYDAVIIACFDDTGLQELKRRTTIPVLGIGEAAFHAASMLRTTFSTITTLAVSIPVIEANIKTYGFAGQSVGVRAAGVPVLEIGAKSQPSIRAQAQLAREEDGCGAIVLGCAGMADLADALSQDLGCPVIDGIRVAVGFCEVLNRVQTR